MPEKSVLKSRVLKFAFREIKEILSEKRKDKAHSVSQDS